MNINWQNEDRDTDSDTDTDTEYAKYVEYEKYAEYAEYHPIAFLVENLRSLNYNQVSTRGPV